MSMPFTQLSYREYFDNIGKLGVRITCPDSSIIEGLLIDPNVMSYQNNWTSMKDLELMGRGLSAAGGLAGSKGSQIARWIQGGLSGGRSLINEFRGTSQIMMNETVKTYQGPSNPGVKVNLLVMKEFQQNYADIIKSAIQLANPEELGTGVAGSITPPHSYDPPSFQALSYKGVQVKSCTVQIQSHFLAKELLCDSIEIKDGPTTRFDNEPIYRVISAAFSTWRAVDYQEVQDWYTSL